MIARTVIYDSDTPPEVGQVLVVVNPSTGLVEGSDNAGGGGGGVEKFTPAGADHLYQVLIDDMGTKILSDQDTIGYTIFTLPLLADALEHGGIIRILATKSALNGGNYANMLGVYAVDGGRRFRMGSTSGVAETALYSLWSSNPGDYLELVARDVPGDKAYWQVTFFSGFWEDRD